MPLPTTPHPGKWELLLNANECELSTDNTAIHAVVVANRNTGAWKVLYFPKFGTPQSRLWDPLNPTQVSPPQPIPPWPVPGADPSDLFCSGHSHMVDGRLLVAGGNRPGDPGCQGAFRGLRYSFFFDPITEAWSPAGPLPDRHPMADGRWYPTLTTLGEGQGYGRILAMSGLKADFNPGTCVVDVNKNPEIYDTDTGWSLMANPTLAVQPFNALYTGAHVVPLGVQAGKVFYSAPMEQAYVFDPYPTLGPYWSPIGAVRSVYRDEGNAVLLPLLPGASSAKVLLIGGGSFAEGTATTEIMDVASGTPAWAAAAPMFHKRRNANAVILPDDRVLVVGGNRSEHIIDPVYTAEAYDVAANSWRLLPAMNRQRVYHSTAVLLPDGRVWAAGSEITGAFEANIEVYSPGYLFEGDRPTITNAPTTIHYNTTFNVTSSLPIAAIRLIRLGSTTHAQDMDQRSVGLAFLSTIGHYSVTAPLNANVAPPGLYMLFVLRPASASLSQATMIPSVGKIVRVKKP